MPRRAPRRSWISKPAIAKVSLDPRRQPRRDQNLQQDDRWPSSPSSRPASTWPTYLARARASTINELLVAQPSAFTGIAALVRKAPLAGAQGPAAGPLARYLCRRICRRRSTDENLRFLRHQAQRHAARSSRDGSARSISPPTILTDDVSKLYVAKYFPPETKAAIDELVANVVAAMGRRIDKLDLDGARDQGQGARPSSPPSRPRSAIPSSGAIIRRSRSRRDDLFGNALRANQLGS